MEDALSSVNANFIPRSPMSTMSKCPICTLELLEANHSGRSLQCRCERCGNFTVPSIGAIGNGQAFEGNDKRRALVSHFIRKMQNGNEWPYLDADLLNYIVTSNTLPKPVKQAENFLLWLGEQADWSEEEVTVTVEKLQAIIGGGSLNSVGYIANELLNREFIWFNRTDTAKTYSPLRIGMKFSGWEEFENLQTQSTESKTVFMAMKFGDPELDAIVSGVIRPAVASTGFTLQVLYDTPRAGLIDDRMRVEIRRCKFMIADLTHANNGAYWEAGYAEGLGKQVIYTCKQANAKDIHFDTNHMLNIRWGRDPDTFAEDLKATIRATFPTEAKLYD